jgi:hypothetical protein
VRLALLAGSKPALIRTSKQVGDKNLKVFATMDAATKWFEENDPEGVAFEYEVIGQE